MLSASASKANIPGPRKEFSINTRRRWIAAIRNAGLRYRIWHWLKVIVKNDVRIATDLMLLLMIVDTLFLRVLSVSATSQPSPQVTVNVTVDAEGIAEKVAKRSKTKGVCLVPEPTTEEKPHE